MIEFTLFLFAHPTPCNELVKAPSMGDLFQRYEQTPTKDHRSLKFHFVMLISCTSLLHKHIYIPNSSKTLYHNHRCIFVWTKF